MLTYHALLSLKPPSGGFLLPGGNMVRAMIVVVVVAAVFGLTAWLAYRYETRQPKPTKEP